MNNTNLFNVDPTDPAVIARRNAATIDFKEKAHRLYHERNGADARCHRCGTAVVGKPAFNL
jgi:hypothetical protein